MTLEEVSAIIGKSVPFIRESLKEGTCPFGFCIKDNRARIDYYISPKLFKEYTGYQED